MATRMSEFTEFSGATNPGSRESTNDPGITGLLIASLETIGTPFILLDAGVVAYLTPSAEEMLGLPMPWALEVLPLVGKGWADAWAELCPGHTVLTVEPQFVSIQRGAAHIDLLAWQRPVEGTAFSLVGLQKPSSEDEHEREVLRVLSNMQEQADDLFALYQITQFLNITNELDLLCSTFLRELERITHADVACLYLASPAEGLVPAVWHGLDTAPPIRADSDSALQWFTGQPTIQESNLHVLSLPLMAEERLVGLALLAHSEVSEKEPRFLQTVAKEMGTALLVMEGRQELLAQEQKLEAIVASTTDAIIQVGIDRRIRDFNPAAERLTGYSASDALTRTCAGIFGCAASDEGRRTKDEGSFEQHASRITRHEPGGCGGNCPFVQVLTEREPIPYAEIVVAGSGRGSEKRHIAASVAALDLGKELPAAVGILRDMSKQKQIEQMKSDFLATVSHQLRTPLALLRGYVDTLLHLELSPQEQSSCITGIADTATRLERLVTQILDVTRIEEGRMELQREPVRLIDLLRGAISVLPLNLHRSRVWAEVSADLPRLDADPHRLEQVLINLLDNALKYSPPTGQVVIRAKQVGSYVEVQVLDEGIGILPEDREAVFDKFQRGSNARTLQLPGTGLGLFICRSIVEAHGGDISASDGPDGGTEIKFRVPVLA